jgi:hypothetical protein
MKVSVMLRSKLSCDSILDRKLKIMALSLAPCSKEDLPCLDLPGTADWDRQLHPWITFESSNLCVPVSQDCPSLFPKMQIVMLESVPAPRISLVLTTTYKATMKTRHWYTLQRKNVTFSYVLTLKHWWAYNGDKDIHTCEW